MGLLVNILKRIIVINAVSNGKDFSYHLSKVTVQNEKMLVTHSTENIPVAEIAGKRQKGPVILIISGKGVIFKEFTSGSEEAKQIMNHPELFLFACQQKNENRLQITFLRRTLYEDLSRELSLHKLPVVDIRITANKDLTFELEKAVQDYSTTKLSIKEVLTPNFRSKALLALLVDKSLLPVLLGILVILIGNFFIQENLTEQLKDQQLLMSESRKNTIKEQKQSAVKQYLLDNLATEIQYPYSWIADKIASVIPPDIVLTDMGIQPLAGKIQVNRPVNVETNRIVLKGSSKESASITTLADSITSLGIFTTVGLNSINKDRNNNYLFEINLEL